MRPMPNGRRAASNSPTARRRTSGATAPSYTNYTAVYDPSQVNLTLAPGSAAIDAGTVIPNVTDGFTGKAPDLGAYEFGQPVPHYGPR